MTDDDCGAEPSIQEYPLWLMLCNSPRAGCGRCKTRLGHPHPPRIVRPQWRRRELFLDDEGNAAVGADRGRSARPSSRGETPAGRAAG